VRLCEKAREVHDEVMTVLLAELASRLGASPQVALRLLDRVGAKVSEDGLGRLVVADSAAREAVELRDQERDEGRSAAGRRTAAKGRGAEYVRPQEERA
jgi:hypothetical protein